MEAVTTVAAPDFVTNRNPKYVHVTLYLERHLKYSTSSSLLPNQEVMRLKAMSLKIFFSDFFLKGEEGRGRNIDV